MYLFKWKGYKAAYSLCLKLCITHSLQQLLSYYYVLSTGNKEHSIVLKESQFSKADKHTHNALMTERHTRKTKKAQA